MAKKAKETAPKKGADGGLLNSNPILQTVIAQLEKSFGANIITTVGGNVGLQRQINQIPTGSIGLDIAVGPMFKRPDGTWQTGFGQGRIIECYGPEGTGKTTLTLVLIANAQRLGKTCAFIDAEHNLDPNYAASLGVDLSKLLLSQPNNGEEALQIAEILIRSGQVQLIVIDSVAALIPKAELEGDIGDQAMGAAGRLMSQTLRKFANLLGAKVECNIYFTNQIREKIGVMFGTPETTPGGRALKFFASYRIDVRRTETIKNGENSVGHKMRLKLIKNKTGSPFQETPVDLIWGHGIDTHAELLDLSEAAGLLTKSGAYYYLANTSTLLGQGRDRAIQGLRANNALCYHLYDKLMTTTLAKRGYNPDLSKIEGFISPATAGMPMVDLFKPTDKESPFATKLIPDVLVEEEDEDNGEDLEISNTPANVPLMPGIVVNKSDAGVAL